MNFTVRTLANQKTIKKGELDFQMREAKREPKEWRENEFPQVTKSFKNSFA